MSKLSAHKNGRTDDGNGKGGVKTGITIFALAVLVAVSSADSASQTVPVMGYVANDNAGPERIAAFKKGLTDLGYIEGKNLKIEHRYAKLDQEYHPIMAELVSRKVDIILAGNAPAAVAAGDDAPFAQGGQMKSLHDAWTLYWMGVSATEAAQVPWISAKRTGG